MSAEVPRGISPMRVPLRACALLLMSTLLGCGGGNSQSEKLVVDQIRLLNDYAEQFEAINALPKASKAHDIQQRITKIEADQKANREALEAFSPNQLKDIRARHKEESDRAAERLKSALKVYLAHRPNLKKTP